MNTSGNNAAADTPAEIANQLVQGWIKEWRPKFANCEINAVADLKIHMIASLERYGEAASSKATERIRELEQENATLTSSGLLRCPLCGGPNSPADGGTGRCFHCECGYVQCGAHHTTRMKQAEQSNKELLEALRAIPENLENVDWVRARYNAGIEWGVEWSEGTTDQSLGAFSPWKFCQNVASEIRAALSKHGGQK